MAKKFTDRQKAFISAYVELKNATQAAIKAGYGKSDEAAAVMGSRFLKMPKIKAEIDKKLNALNTKYEVSAEMVLKELVRLATVDISEAYDEKGWLKDLKDIPEDVRRAMAGLESQELFQGEGEDRSIIGMSKKIKFHDKVRALELLAKHLKLLTDKVEVSGKITLEDIVGGSSDDEQA